MTNAAQFNGTGERLTRTTGPSPNAAYTVAFWVRVDSYKSADYQTLFTFLMGGAEWETIMLDASNRLVIEAGVSGAGNRVNAASAFGTGTWKYVALVRASTTSLKAYVDGAEVLSLTTNVSGRSAAVSEFAFGSDTYNEDSNSSIAYARAWSAALNTTELAAEKVSETAVRSANLYDSWPMQANGNGANGNNLTAVGTVSYVTTGPGFPVTVAPAIASAAASATSPTVVAGSGGTTVTPAAASAAAVAIAPTVQLGAISLTPSAAQAAATARGEVLLAACTAGILHVSTANPRYFANAAGIVPLAGFHTWETLVDHGDSDPPDAFDYDAFLDALVADGCNFIKLWACESLQDWCDAVKYFSPYIYQRTGPGNAADGKLKVDLTLFNQTYFGRLRERTIEAGNRGLYVCVQLFQGWQVEQKGYSVGAPGTYHPYNAANNINSIDGDTDNDGELEETRSAAFTAVYNLQKAYIAKVLDTLADLDHVFYEISNEDTTGSVAWQHALIDYIHTYESSQAKQHPVGMTVIYPGGSDTDLFSSNAEWISPRDGGTYTSPTASSGAKVILYDTDHIDGLTETHQWIFRALCRGLNPLFMDPWDGDFYGVDMRADAEHVRIRNMLGYALDYAGRIDLANATPQSSLSSTGFALAKTTGTAQILAYQDASGAFTVNLTAISGVFGLEWLRTSNGATQAGSNVTGGAVRTLTPPWSGEDVVAFLEKLAEAVEPALAAAIASATNPTVILGALVIVPAAASSPATASSPAIILGAIVIAPTAAASAGTATAPTVILGAVVITPAAGTADATATAPAVILGALTLGPGSAASAATATSPAIVLGAVAVAPDPAQAAASATAPDVQAGGAISVTPGAATATADAIAPAVILGALTLAPAVASAAASAPDPTVEAGSAISVTPAAAITDAAAIAPTVILGAITASPDPATAAASAPDPAVGIGGLSIEPAAASASATTGDPVVILGALVIVASAATAQASASAPELVFGASTASPAPASAAASAPSPTIVIGVIVAAVTLTARRNFTLTARRNFTLTYRR